MSVFVAYKDGNHTMAVGDARPWQETAYKFYNTLKEEGAVKFNIDFKYPENINFSLYNFDANGLRGDYDSFCMLKNERNEEYIVSNNEKLLENFVAYRNKITAPFKGGFFKKRKSKRKKSKKRKTLGKRRKTLSRKKSTKKK